MMILKMMSLAALMAAQLAVAPPALAQDALSAAATKFYNSCRTNQKGTPMECSCTIGYYAGAMEEDEFLMVAEVARFIDESGNVNDMPGAQAAAEAQRALMGMTRERFTVVMQRFVEVGERASTYSDRVCGPTGLRNLTQ